MPPRATRPRAPLALICGDDEFAVKRRARQLFEQWSAEAGAAEQEVLDAGAANAGEALRALGRLREALQTLPFFGGSKIIWFRDCNFLGDERTAATQAVTENLADLADELKAFPWDNVRLLISAGKVDKRRVFYKTLDKLGTVESFEALSLEDRDWAAQAEALAERAVRERGKGIRGEALARLVAMVGPHTRQLQSEAEKLCLYVGARAQIEVADVEAVVTRHKQARAFALGDALGERDLPRLLRCLDEELWEMKFDKQRSEIGLLYGLIGKVRAMIFAKELQRAGLLEGEFGDYDFPRFKAQLGRLSPDQFASDKRFSPLGVNPFVLFRAAQHARRYRPEELVRAMDLLLQCNRRLVSSSQEEAMVLQQTLVQIVKGAGELSAAA